MRVAVRFGKDILELMVADDRLVMVAGESPQRPLPNVADAVAAAIQSPLEFPALR